MFVLTNMFAFDLITIYLSSERAVSGCESFRSSSAFFTRSHINGVMLSEKFASREERKMISNVSLAQETKIERNKCSFFECSSVVYLAQLSSGVDEVA